MLAGNWPRAGSVVLASSELSRAMHGITLGRTAELAALSTTAKGGVQPLYCLAVHLWTPSAG